MDDCPNMGFTSPSLAPNPPPNPPPNPLLPDVAAPNEALFDADAPNPDDGVDCNCDSPKDGIGLEVEGESKDTGEFVPNEKPLEAPADSPNLGASDSPILNAICFDCYWLLD